MSPKCTGTPARIRALDKTLIGEVDHAATVYAVLL